MTVAVRAKVRVFPLEPPLELHGEVRAMFS